MKERKRIDFPLPFHQEFRPCKLCGTPIAFSGKNPLDLSTMEKVERDGLGAEWRAESHFATCPHADEFRKKRRPK